MSILLKLSALAMRESVTGACKACGVGHAIDAIERVTGFLRQHFRDHSDRLAKALRGANSRAWQTLEIALTGDSFWDRARNLLASGDDKRFRQEIQKYLNALVLPDDDPKAFRRACLAELRAARKQGLLDGGALDPEPLANEVGAFARYGDPLELLSAENQLLISVAETLRREHYESLAKLIQLQPRPDTSLLTVAVRFFFRRSVEDDSKLFQGLAFAQLEKIQRDQGLGFESLRELFDQQADAVQKTLDEVQADLFATYNAVLDVREEQQRQAGQNDDIFKAVIQLQQRLDLMHTELRPRDSLSIRGDGERQLVKELVSRYRSLPEARRKELPALLNAVGKLQAASGDFQAAEKDFQAVAALVDDGPAKAEAHFNAFRIALERRDWASALTELQSAVKLDARRFEPFPFRKYRPMRILGAGGFGVAYLCMHQRVNAEVVVKTLMADDLDRSLTDVFAEARVLRMLDHPAIIGLRDCDYADDALTRPYLEMDYFASLSLEEHVRQHGPLTEADLTEIARHMAEGLKAAHARSVLHRDVKPGNVLLCKSPAGAWRVKLIDFGLALSTARLTGSGSERTLRGSSIAGTIDYAAPEQMGKLTSTPVTEASDVYGFGRTCFYALFGTPYPKAKHFDKLSAQWKSLLDDCTSEVPGERPANFQVVLDRMAGKPTPATPGGSPATAANPLGSWGQKAAGWFKSTFGPNPRPQVPPPASPAPAPTPATVLPAPSPPVPVAAKAAEPAVVAPPPGDDEPETLDAVPVQQKKQPSSDGIEIVDDVMVAQPVRPQAKKPPAR